MQDRHVGDPSSRPKSPLRLVLGKKSTGVRVRKKIMFWFNCNVCVKRLCEVNVSHSNPAYLMFFILIYHSICLREPITDILTLSY